jgi:hypothetical protein
MKNVIAFAVVVVIGLVAFNYFSTGEFKIVPGVSMSQGENEVNNLKGEFRRAVREYRQAARQAGMSGMDNLTEVENALAKVDGVERELQRLRNTTVDPDVGNTIDEVLAEIKQFKIDIR